MLKIETSTTTLRILLNLKYIADIQRKKATKLNGMIKTKLEQKILDLIKTFDLENIRTAYKLDKKIARNCFNSFVRFYASNPNDFWGSAKHIINSNYLAVEILNGSYLVDMINTLPNLTEICIWDKEDIDEKTDLSFIGGIECAHTLILDRIRGSLPDSISSLRDSNSVKNLIIKSGVFSDFPESFGDLQNIEYLKFESCSFKNIGHLPKIISKLNNLKHISISKTFIGDQVLPEWFRSLPKLRKISLEDVHIDSFGGFQNCSNLKEVWLGGFNILRNKLFKELIYAGFECSDRFPILLKRH